MKISNANTNVSRLISLSPIFKLRNQTQSALIETCGHLSSIKEFALLAQAARLIDSPVGEYYEAVASNKNEFSNPDAYFVEAVPDKFKGRMILSIGQCYRHKGELPVALALCSEAARLSARFNDPVNTYQAIKEIAIIHSTDGNHESAFRHLESAAPLVRCAARVRPFHYYDYLNSLAVELNDLGEVDRAALIIKIPLASPFAGLYSEWLDTSDGIALKQRHGSRSVVAGSEIVSDKVLRPDWSAARARLVSPGEAGAEVRNITERNRLEMPKKKKQEEAEDYAHLEKRAELHRIIADPDTTGEELDELLKRYEELKSRQTEQK